MSRRTYASLLAVVLIAGLVLRASLYPVKYVIYSPGPTFNVLGQVSGKAVLSVSGHRSYHDGGGLRMLTVSPTGPQEKVGLIRTIVAWISPTQAVYPYDDVYQPTDSEQSVEAQSAQEMTSSQDNAVAAALTYLKIPFQPVVKAVQVDPKGPAKGHVSAGDAILAVDGTPVTGVVQVIDKVRAVPPGTPVTLRLKHAGATTTTTVTTVPNPQDRTKSAIKVTVAPSFDFPFKVGIHLDPNIGGPSAGMMFALGIYDLLTPGSLTHGKVVAGTGEITPAGNVGEIGGIQQKLVGAQDAGAQLFLVPAGNCAEALGGHYDPAKMRLVRVQTLSDAIKDVKAWTANPNAKLPECTR